MRESVIYKNEKIHLPRNVVKYLDLQEGEFVEFKLWLGMLHFSKKKVNQKRLQMLHLLDCLLDNGVSLGVILPLKSNYEFLIELFRHLEVKSVRIDNNLDLKLKTRLVDQRLDIESDESFDFLLIDENARISEKDALYDSSKKAVRGGIVLYKENLYKTTSVEQFVEFTRVLPDYLLYVDRNEFKELYTVSRNSNGDIHKNLIA